MFKKHSALEKEMQRLERQEQSFLRSREEKSPSKLNALLEDKVPKGLNHTLNEAFSKAFELIFQKGTGIIEKSYNKEKLTRELFEKEYDYELWQDRSSLNKITKNAAGSGRLNIFISAASGLGLGVLGIGLPDIALFTALLLKGVYEIAANYGFDYKSDSEKQFILLVIQGAVSYGEELYVIDRRLNQWIAAPKDEKPQLGETDEMTCSVSSALSAELLYMKFLQSIPIVGVVGGAYDAVYMKKVTRYAELKYRRRYFEKIKA